MGGPYAGRNEVDQVMVDEGGSDHREQSGALGVERAEHVLRLAWFSLPPADRALLEAIGASQWQAVDQPLGGVVDGFLRSAGHPALAPSAQRKLDLALGVWIQELRIVLVHAGHAKLAGLDNATFEAFIARTAWHEWGHALSVVRCSQEDIAAGRTLLDLAPAGIRGGIRDAGYRPNDYTHELVAETYALLMARRRRKASGRPPWLDDEIYSLVRRVAGWTG